MVLLGHIPQEITQIDDICDFIGNISPGQKIHFKYNVYVGRFDLYKRFRRYMDGEDRKYTLENLNKIFKSFLLIKIDNDVKYYPILDASFMFFFKGVKVLCDTYQDEDFNEFLSKLEKYESLIYF